MSGRLDSRSPTGYEKLTRKACVARLRRRRDHLEKLINGGDDNPFLIEEYCALYWAIPVLEIQIGILQEADKRRKDERDEPRTRE